MELEIAAELAIEELDTAAELVEDGKAEFVEEELEIAAVLELEEVDPFQTPGASPMWEPQPPRGYKGKIRPGMGVQKRMTPRRGTFDSLGYEIDYNTRDAERMRSLSATSYKLRMMEWKEMRERNSI